MNATPTPDPEVLSADNGQSIRSFATSLAPFLSILALVLSALATIETRRIATSDFEAGEQVKAYAAELASTMISLVHKGVLALILSDSAATDMSVEKQRIASFLTSPSAMAYHYYASERSASAGSGQPEAWRLFTPSLHTILEADDPSEVIGEARAVLGLLETLDESQIDSMTTFVGESCGCYIIAKWDHEESRSCSGGKRRGYFPHFVDAYRHRCWASW